MLIIDDLEQKKPSKVIVGGQLVASNGSIVTKIRKHAISNWIKKTVKTAKSFAEKDFVVKNTKSTVVANVIEMETEIITKHTTEELKTKDGNVVPDFNKDVWKVAAFERTNLTGKHMIGFLKNFGANVGAFASTWSFHENDMIIIGSNEKDMAFAANHLVRSQGGVVVVKDSKIVAFLPLRVGGIVSENSFDDVLQKFVAVNSALTDNGCRFQRPHLVPLFLPFLALPSVRILSCGIVDVKKRSLLPTIY